MTVSILGGINQDIVLTVTALPRPGETIAARGIAETAGGKGLNQAVAAARFGSVTRLLGAVGDDSAGATLRAGMIGDRIDDSGVITMGMPTGRAFIAVTGTGENSIIVEAGANRGFGARELEQAMRPSCVSLTQFEARADAIEALLGMEQAGLRILNAAPAVTERRDLLAMADMLIVNETECQRFAVVDRLPGDPAAIAHIARTLLAGRLRHIIVTLGERGCLLVDRADHWSFPGFTVPVVNTVGAGDCFCGVLAAALSEGAVLPTAIRYAMAAAALSVGRAGAADAMPTRDEIETFLAKEGAALALEVEHEAGA